MSREVTEKRNMGLTWENRLALWLPGLPLLGAVLIAACLIAAYLGFQWFFGLDAHRIAILVTLMIAYLLMMPRYFAPRDADLQLYGLEPTLSDRHETEVRALQAPRDKIRRSRLAGAAGALAVFAVNEVAATLEGADLVASLIRIHGGSAMLPLSLLVGWMAGRAIYFTFACPYDLPRLDSSDIDLLNLDNLYAIGRTGLRSAFLVLFGVSIGGLIFLDTVIGLWGTLPVFAIGLGIGLVVLLRPAREVRSLIRAVKHEELARLGPLLRQARDDTLTGDGSTQGRLTDLMTYQARIESTPEWPFDSSTLVRFGLYLLIPVGAMIGGALVERVVDMVLD